MSYSISLDVPVPMRDGVKLSTNILRPESDEPVPVLLMRGPYNLKDQIGMWGASPNLIGMLRHGYAVVMQDCRGTFASEGTFVPHAADAEDGLDTIAWLVEQEWCDGNVGGWGASYLGFTQWHAAAAGAPGLKAIAPSFSSADLYRGPWYSPGAPCRWTLCSYGTCR